MCIRDSSKRKAPDSQISPDPAPKKAAQRKNDERPPAKNATSQGSDVGQITIGNAYKSVTNGEKPHKWTMFVRGPDPTVRNAHDLGIEKVVFKLHPDYSPSEIIVSKSPFEVTRYGWGTFDVNLEIFPSGGSKKVVKHALKFDDSISVSKTLSVSLNPRASSTKRKR
eukprot:TRINITY_DN1003_c0_g1_i2.p1 TRINITY_DN1003_c0_g1~~TRINITY_DN1003_c0_g1_i2.p1  ORF type:complete len:167 (+),score=7.48 TRINITY_DN1003_c0_g1_i2:179-679(+)